MKDNKIEAAYFADTVTVTKGIIAPPLPSTVTVYADSIKLIHKEMNIEIELDSEKFENIDTIIINEFKYVKEK